MAEVRHGDAVVGLAQAVRGLRAELEDAMTAAQDEELRFAVGSVRMDFTVEVHADVKAKTGVRFWVVEAGAEAGAGSKATHTISLELTPRTAGGAPPEINDLD
jgi:Trypsin-co-occurring domain 2